MWTEYSLFVVLWQDEKEDVNAAVGKAHSQRFESNRQESPLRGAFVLVTLAPAPDADSIPTHVDQNEKAIQQIWMAFTFWWRRRESNPRPQALYRQFYILSLVILFNLTHANRRALVRRVTYCLALAQSNPAQHDLVNDSASSPCGLDPAHEKAGAEPSRY